MADSFCVAKRCAPEVPMWDILVNGQNVGVATVFDYEGEGPMATIRYGYDDEPVTFSGSSIRDVLAKVGKYVRDMNEAFEQEAVAEYYAEVLGPMEAAERAAENAYRGGEDEPVW